MKITKFNQPGQCCTGRLFNTSVEEINQVLGFQPNIKDDPYKVKHSWGFKADGVPCGIWDYNGSETIGQFSTYGPTHVFVSLFGNKYRNDRT